MNETDQLGLCYIEHSLNIPPFRLWKAMKQIFEGRLVGQVRWRIHRQDPIGYAFKFTPFVLVNPLLYRSLGVDKNYGGFPYQIMAVEHNEVLLETNALMWLADAEVNFESPAHGVGLTDNLYSWLGQLRRFTSQLELSRAFPGVLSNRVDLEIVQTLPSCIFPEVDLASSYWLHNYLWDTGITLDALQKADKALVTADFPIYQATSLDALQAHAERDIRRCLLYCAISIEVMAKQVIQVGSVRFVSKGSNESTVDWLFHRLATQVLHKSLKSDNKELFNEVRLLYRTRNSLVHSNTKKDLFWSVSSGINTFHMLQVVEAISNWLGIPYSFLPKGGSRIAHPAKDEPLYFGPTPQILPILGA